MTDRIGDVGSFFGVDHTQDPTRLGGVRVYGIGEYGQLCNDAGGWVSPFRDGVFKIEYNGDLYSGYVNKNPDGRVIMGVFIRVKKVPGFNYEVEDGVTVHRHDDTVLLGCVNTEGTPEYDYGSLVRKLDNVVKASRPATCKWLDKVWIIRQGDQDVPMVVRPATCEWPKQTSCPDCKGTGVYVGLLSRERCRTCAAG